MSDFPDQHADDTRFAQLFSEWGVQTKMRRLMGVSLETFRRMLNPGDHKHPSDLHRGRRLVYASYEFSEDSGDDVWAELEAAKAMGRGARPDNEPVTDADLFRALSGVMNARLDGAHSGEQLRVVRRAIGLLKRRERELAGASISRGGGQSPERADTQEAGAHQGRTPAAASGLEDGLDAEEGEELTEQAGVGGGRGRNDRAAGLVGIGHRAVGAGGAGGE